MSDSPRRSLVSLIVSKDRPMQLDGLLRSVSLTCRDRELADWRVLYKASSRNCGELYGWLAEEYPWARFVAETDFRGQLRSLAAGYDHVLFLVDDSCFVRPFGLEEGVASLASQSDVLGFSLRLGRNTTKSYVINQPMALPNFTELAGGLLRFRWTTAQHCFGYPLEVSSSIYRLSDVGPLLDSLPYANPNTLEAQLSQAVGRFRESRPGLACYETSVAFSNPLNRVQQVFRNRCSSDGAYSATRMLRQFADGWRIDVSRLLGHVPSGCHEEVAVELMQPPDARRRPAAESWLARWWQRLRQAG